MEDALMDLCPRPAGSAPTSCSICRGPLPGGPAADVYAVQRGRVIMDMVACDTPLCVYAAIAAARVIKLNEVRKIS